MPLKRFKSSRPERLTCAVAVMGMFVYLATLGCGDVRVEATGGDDDDFLSLGLSMSPSSHSAPAPTLTAAMTKIINDDVSGEFVQTEALIRYLSGALEQFGRQEHLETGRSDTLTAWLAKQVSAGKSAGQSAWLEKIVRELNYLYASYWTQFQPLVQQLVSERPAKLGATDLAFRCERYEQLKALVQMGSVSALYRIALDVFSQELYTHCLRRKLALVKLHQLRPSPVVRQFVDLYLDLPVNYESLLVRSHVPSEHHQLAVNQIQSGQALRFQLQEAVARHGPLEGSAKLIFDSSASLSTGSDREADAKRLVERFKVDCARYSSELATIWSTFDDLAAFLSSPLNDLAAFNAQIKLVVSELTYAAVCSQLASLAR